MRFVAGFLGALWQFSRDTWISIDPNLRPRSGASALMMFLFLLFFVIGTILFLLGFDLNEVDRWIDAQGGWLDALGSTLFRLLCGAILVLSAGIVVAGLWLNVFGGPPELGKEKDEGIGFGMILVIALIGYFAWFGVTG
jgi:hypothetical protein